MAGSPDGEFERQLVALVPELHGYCRRVTGSPDVASDLVQDAMVRAIEGKSSFQPGTNLRAWAFTILRNLARDRGRRLTRQGPHVSVSDDGEDHEIANLASPPAQEKVVQHGEFQRAFASLPRHQRWILMRVGPEGESYSDVADWLGVAVGTVKSRVSRARAHLHRIQSELEPLQRAAPRVEPAHPRRWTSDGASPGTSFSPRSDSARPRKGSATASS